MPPRRKRGAKATKSVPPTVYEEPLPKRHRGVDKQGCGESAGNRSANDDDVLPGAKQGRDSEEVGSQRLSLV